METIMEEDAEKFLHLGENSASPVKQETEMKRIESKVSS